MAKTLLRRRLISSALLLAAACGGPSKPTATIAGRWSGTTSQGTAIAFLVSDDQKITSLTFAYRFTGCEGSLTYTPNVALTAISTAPVPVYTGIFDSAPDRSANRALVNFLVTSTTEAHGTIIFNDFAGCEAGPVTAAWTAAKP